MAEKLASEITSSDHDHLIRFRRPGTADYGRPVISGRLIQHAATHDALGRPRVTVTVQYPSRFDAWGGGSTNSDQFDLPLSFKVNVGHLWREKAARSTEWNIPLEDDPILYAKLHKGPFDGQQKLIGGHGRHWDERGLLMRDDDGLFAFYEHSHIPDGVRRRSNAMQRKHGFGSTVLVGTVHMKYQRVRSKEINEEETRRLERLDRRRP